MTADAAAIMAFADVVEGRADVVAERLPAALAELATDGPTDSELAARRTELRRQTEFPAFMAAVTTTTAWDLLHGRTTQTIAEILDDAERVTASDVAAAADALRGEALLQVPNGVPVPPAPWVPAPISPAQPVAEGRRFAWLAGPDQLVVSPEGVSVAGSEMVVTVRHESLAALGRWDDGGRVLIGEDGVHLTVEPTLWRRGKQAVALIDAAAPDSAVVPLGARDPDSVPRAPRNERLRRVLNSTAFELLIVSLPPLSLVTLNVTGQQHLVPMAFGMTTVPAVAVWLRRRRRGT